MALVDPKPPLEQPKKWVGGIVNISPLFGKDHPHTFFEIDDDEKLHHEIVLSTYRMYNIDVISHRCGKGYHYFGGSMDRVIWKEWYNTLKYLNPKWPPLTLRVTKKFPEETWERPVYHEAKEVVPKWSQAVMHFLNNEAKGMNSLNIHKAMEHAGLHKYFKTLVYRLEPNVSL